MSEDMATIEIREVFENDVEECRYEVVSNPIVESVGSEDEEEVGDVKIDVVKKRKLEEDEG